MTDVYIASDNIITPLGFNTIDNATSMQNGKGGIHYHAEKSLAPEPFYASLLSTVELDNRFSAIGDPSHYTRFEKLALCSLHDAFSNTAVEVRGEKTLFVLSTTKGNIDLLEQAKGQKFERERIYLWHTARIIQKFFQFHHVPVVISNACISGLQAIILGARLIRKNHFENIVINGTDIISEFVLSGFNSFKSLSNGPCRPFDKSRDGLSLGEGSGTLILTRHSSLSAPQGKITTGEGFSSNDANHISGPSRTGEGLYQAIKQVQETSDGHVDYISAHGTATLYNDEMESLALTRAGLNKVPMNSFKGYWGHTLGAAGVIETIMGIYSMQKNILFSTMGFQASGVSNPVAVIDKTQEREIKTFIKTASGFGGCNAAMIFHKT